ncbi:MAG: cohesin domain-containing protein [Patescibacteria group bacterium]|nr:cohesin domain-containing protein [Patescibacteria group bacterium]
MKNYNLKFKTFSFLVVVFSFSFLIFPLVVRGATLYLLPQSQTIYKNDTFLVEVRLDTEGEEINAVEVSLTFPPNLLEVFDLGKGGSVLDLWVKEPSIIDNKASFIGGIPGGFKGDGLIGKITFWGKEIGKTEINFGEDSKVLSNDGKGTPALLSFSKGNYSIIEKPEGLPEVSSQSHPDQNKWSKSNNLHLHWDLVEGAEYSYLLSKDPLAKSDEIPDKPEGELVWMGDMEYKGLDEGIYYFTLKQKLLGEDWSEPISYRAMIDVTPPEEFTLEIGQELTIFEGKYFLSFATIDKISGIDHYEVRDGKGDWKIAESPYLLKDQSLKSKILVRAVDKAGNEKIGEIIPHEKPFPYLMVILIGLAITVMVIWWLRKNISPKD